MISDFHRNLLQGGIYYYPGDMTKPEGKIRLLLEAQALAFIAEQAGGYASDGIGDVLDVQPHNLHQRTPLFIGNRSLVEKPKASSATTIRTGSTATAPTASAAPGSNARNHSLAGKNARCRNRIPAMI